MEAPEDLGRQTDHLLAGRISNIRPQLRAAVLLMEAESARLNHAPVTALASASSAVEAALKLEEGLSGIQGREPSFTCPKDLV